LKVEGCKLVFVNPEPLTFNLQRVESVQKGKFLAIVEVLRSP